MEKISSLKKGAIIGYYLSGLSYAEIAAKSRVAKGTESNIVMELKAGRFSEAAGLANKLNSCGNCLWISKRSKLTPGIE